MSPYDPGPTDRPPEATNWLSLPARNGRVRLITRAVLVENNPVGFSVESFQRVLIPHVYLVAEDDESHPSSQQPTDAAALTTPVSARAVWCHLIGGLPANSYKTSGRSRPLYRAGFELKESLASVDAAISANANKPEWSRRRVERTTRPQLPLRLEASANIRLLSRPADPAVRRLRFSSTLLPSLGSRVRLEIVEHNNTAKLWAKIVDVGPLRPGNGQPRSWLEVEIEDPSASDLASWIEQLSG